MINFNSKGMPIIFQASMNYGELKQTSKRSSFDKWGHVKAHWWDLLKSKPCWAKNWAFSNISSSAEWLYYVFILHYCLGSYFLASWFLLHPWKLFCMKFLKKPQPGWFCLRFWAFCLHIGPIVERKLIPLLIKSSKPTLAGILWPLTSILFS